MSICGSRFEILYQGGKTNIISLRIFTGTEREPFLLEVETLSRLSEAFMKQPPQVALIIETSVIYGRRVLAGIARYLRSHHRWSVFLEQHELGAPPPNWLTSSRWNGILSQKKKSAEFKSGVFSNS